MKTASPRQILSYAAALAWLLLAVAAYIAASQNAYIQGFFFPGWTRVLRVIARIPALPYIVNLLRACLGVSLFSAASLALGLQVLRRVIREYGGTLGWGVTAFVLGETIYSLIFLSLISFYRLTPIMVSVLLAAGIVVGAMPLLRFLAGLPRTSVAAHLPLAERAILALVAITLAFGLLYSSALLGYDATAEYFSDAKIMAVTRVASFYYPSDLFVVSSFHPGVLFTALIQVFGDQAARLLPWVNGLAILLLGLAIGKVVGLTLRARLYFLVLATTSTAFVDLLGDGKIELISTACILAATYWMVLAWRRPEKGALAVIGLLCGFALISRPYNIFLFSVFALVFCATMIYRQRVLDALNVKSLLQYAPWLLVPLMVLGGYHVMENWLWLKDPLAHLIHYSRNVRADAWQWQFDPKYLNLLRLLYPFTVTYMNTPQSLGNISPLFVGFLPFLLIRSVRIGVQRSLISGSLTLASAGTLVAWLILFFTVVEIRYVLFLWILLFMAMAVVIGSAAEHRVFRWMIAAVLIVLTAYVGARTLVIALYTYAPISADAGPDCRDFALCTPFQEVLGKTAAPGDRVLVLHAYRYYLRPDLFACSSQAQDYWVLEPLAREQTGDFWVQAYRMGFRFITYERHLSEQRYEFGDVPSPATAPKWLRIETLYSSPDRGLQILHVQAVNPPFEPETYCQKDGSGIWQVKSGTPP